MEDQQQQQQNTSLCNAGCGFYGSAATGGLCSKCFKDSIKRTQDTSVNRLSPTSVSAASLTAGSPQNVSPRGDETAGELSAEKEAVEGVPLDGVTAESLLMAATSPIALELSTSSSSPVPPAAADTGSSAASSPSAKKPNRCHICKKRVGLTGFSCRCGGLYCGEHRYVSDHNCTFDWKTMEREGLRKNNPVVVSEKIKRL